MPKPSRLTLTSAMTQWQTPRNPDRRRRNRSPIESSTHFRLKSNTRSLAPGGWSPCAAAKIGAPEPRDGRQPHDLVRLDNSAVPGPQVPSALWHGKGKHAARGTGGVHRWRPDRLPPLPEAALSSASPCCRSHGKRRRAADTPQLKRPVTFGLAFHALACDQS